jgi:hypothetical protein
MFSAAFSCLGVFVQRFFSAFVFVALVVVAMPAAAASQPAPSQQPECGKTVGDALSAARTALAANNPAEDRAALACLIAAVTMLDAGRFDAMRGPDNHKVLHAPVMPTGPGTP